MGGCAQRKRGLAASAGFTLFEVMLVLALIVLIGALAVPAFNRAFETQRLREGGDAIRTAWAKGRIEAMKSGRAMLFRYELAGNQYILEPWHGADEYLELGEAAAATMIIAEEQQQPMVTDQIGSPTKGRTTSLATFGRIHTLPKGILFYGSEQNLDVRGLITQQQIGLDTTLNTSAQWSPPVLFYPDGSASESEVRLTDSEMKRFVLVRLRGLTGIAYVTDIRLAAELDLAIQ